MMVTNNIIGLLFILFMFIIIHKTYSFENGEQEIIDDDIIIEPYIIKSNPFFSNEYLPINKPINMETSSVLNDHRSESAEKYFDWIGKTQRPVEFLRGKRFWLFAKKDETGTNVDLPPSTNTQHSLLTQGLWRSGIVGRRRRR